jgi:predicted small secreted protein
MMMKKKILCGLCVVMLAAGLVLAACDTATGGSGSSGDTLKVKLLGGIYWSDYNYDYQKDPHLPTITMRPDAYEYIHAYFLDDDSWHHGGTQTEATYTWYIDGKEVQIPPEHNVTSTFGVTGPDCTQGYDYQKVRDGSKIKVVVTIIEDGRTGSAESTIKCEPKDE